MSAASHAARERTHLMTCCLCEAMCGLRVTVREGAVAAIQGDELDPLSRGHVCPKALALKEIHSDPDRLRTPLVRAGTTWKSASWEAALDAAAERLLSVRERFGPQSLALYQGNPTIANYGTQLVAPELVRSIGGPRLFSTASIDHAPSMLAALQLFGHQFLMPVPDLDRTQFVLMLGANPAVSNGSLMSAPGFKQRVRALRQRGGTLVVVDPRRTETAALADEHYFIHPGQDALLLLSLLQVIFAADLVDLGHLADLIDGVDQVRRVCQRYTPELVGPRIGIDPQAVRDLALRFARAEAAVCYGRLGISAQRFGGLCAWLVCVLNAVTGNLDRRGGFMLTKPAFDSVRVASLLGMSGSFEPRPASPRGLPRLSGEEPVATLGEEIEHKRIRALICVAGNPVLSTPNGRRLERALREIDALVSIDLYLNETHEHAHVILPPTFALERDHYDVAHLAFAVRHVARYSQPLFSPGIEQRHDWQIYLALADRFAKARKLAGLGQRLRNHLIAWLEPRRILDLVLRLGPHRLSLRRLIEQPHGVDLGPLEPCLRERLHTPGRRIRLAPRIYLDDMERLERAHDLPAERGLTLIGRRHLRSNNSWMHNSPLLSKGPPRCTLLMHPLDAASRRVASGDTVRVASRVGQIDVPICVSDEMMPGVVSLPHGYGHGRAGARLSVAAAAPGESANDVTDDLLVDRLSGTASVNGVPVEITALPPT